MRLHVRVLVCAFLLLPFNALQYPTHSLNKDFLLPPIGSNYSGAAASWGWDVMVKQRREEGDEPNERDRFVACGERSVWRWKGRRACARPAFYVSLSSVGLDGTCAGACE